jgi:hypothetical protein
MTSYDMVVLWIVIGIPTAIGYVATKQYGVLGGIGAALLSAVPCIIAVILMWRIRRRKK